MAIVTIVLAVVVAQAIGWFWYSQKAFGKPWMRLMGMNVEERVHDEKAKQGMGRAMTINLLLSIVTAIVLYGLMNRYGLMVPCVLAAWLALAFPVYAGSALWDSKSWKLVWINAGQGLVSTAAMAAIIYWMM